MFLVAPQWQGSGSSRALRLREGAESIAGDLPSAATQFVEIPVEAGEAQGTGIARYSCLVTVRDRIRASLADQLGVGNAAGPVITVGGDASVSLAAVEHAWRDDTALIWFDAHGALLSPQEYYKGAFHRMVLRTLMGDGVSSLVPSRSVPQSRVFPVGTRSLEPAEEDYLMDIGVAPHRDPTPQALCNAVRASGARSVYLHIDLDVIDPAEFTGVSFPEPFGISCETLLSNVRALVSEYELVGASIVEFAPADPVVAADDLPTILRIIAALRSS